MDALYSAFFNIRLYELLKDIIELDKDLLDDQDNIRSIISIIEKSDQRLVVNYLFVNIVSTMEVYLKERLIEKLNEDEQLTYKFLREYKYDRKLTVDDVFNGPETLLNSFLDSIIYHNVKKVDAMYKIVFGVSIMGFINQEALNWIVELRHIIVHDAGFTKSGKKVEIFDDHALWAMNQVTRFVESIDYFIRNGKVRKKFRNYLNSLINSHDQIFESLSKRDTLLAKKFKEIGKRVDKKQLDEIITLRSF